MVLEQISRLSDGDYEQSMMVQLFLDCIDRTNASTTAFVSFREPYQRKPDTKSSGSRPNYMDVKVNSTQNKSFVGVPGMSSKVGHDETCA